MSGQRHPYAGHPAALILADHPLVLRYAGVGPAVHSRCACGWTGPSCDHPAHLAEILDQAGLLAPVAESRTLTQILADTIRKGTDDPVLLARVDQMLDQAGLLKEDARDLP